MTIATAIDGTVLVFTASNGRDMIDTDTDLEALVERVQARADAEDDGRQATPHYVISLWHAGVEDERNLHVYGQRQRGGSVPPTMTNTVKFHEALDVLVNGPTVTIDAAAIADALNLTLFQMNALDDLAYQRPGSAYQHTVDALLATLAQAITGERQRGSEVDPMPKAKRLYEEMLDSGESATYILKQHGYRIVQANGEPV